MPDRSPAGGHGDLEPLAGAVDELANALQVLVGTIGLQPDRRDWRVCAPRVAAACRRLIACLDTACPPRSSSPDTDARRSSPPETTG